MAISSEAIIISLARQCEDVQDTGHELNVQYSLKHAGVFIVI